MLTDIGVTIIISAIQFILSAIFIAIGASVYTYFNADNFTNAVQFEWSYYLCWCAFVLAVVTLGLTVHDARHLTPPYPNAERLHWNVDIRFTLYRRNLKPL